MFQRLRCCTLDDVDMIIIVYDFTMTINEEHTVYSLCYIKWYICICNIDQSALDQVNSTSQGLPALFAMAAQLSEQDQWLIVSIL